MAETKQRATGLTWEEVCSDPNLQDLPYKIETNQWGQIVMSPTYQWHGRSAFRIAKLLEDYLPEGSASVESAIQTSDGTKVADAVWCSAERWKQIKDAYDAPVAPEICVEVLSRTNTEAEMEQKRQLYFEAGAEEVWTCDREGHIRFYDADGPQETSRRAPDFPTRVEI